jgi:hypothetical protein
MRSNFIIGLFLPSSDTHRQKWRHVVWNVSFLKTKNALSLIANHCLAMSQLDNTPPRWGYGRVAQICVKRVDITNRFQRNVSLRYKLSRALVYRYIIIICDVTWRDLESYGVSPRQWIVTIWLRSDVISNTSPVVIVSLGKLFDRFRSSPAMTRCVETNGNTVLVWEIPCSFWKYRVQMGNTVLVLPVHQTPATSFRLPQLSVCNLQLAPRNNISK